MKALNRSSRLDRELADRLNNLNAQNERLTKVRGEYLLKKAEFESFENSAIQSGEGKSIAERTVKVKASKEWLALKIEVNHLLNALEHEETRYDILDKAFQAEYLSAKLDAETIKRQVGA